jgi:hypothetical protein
MKDNQSCGWLDASLIDSLLLLTHGDVGDTLSFNFANPAGIGTISASVQNIHANKLHLLDYEMKMYTNYAIDWQMVYDYYCSTQTMRQVKSKKFSIKKYSAAQLLDSDPTEWMEKILQWRLESLLAGKQAPLYPNETLMDHIFEGWLDIVHTERNTSYNALKDVLNQIRNEVFMSLSRMDFDPVPDLYTTEAQSMIINEPIVGIQSRCYDIKCRIEGTKLFLQNSIITETSPYSILQMMFLHLTKKIIQPRVLQCLCSSQDIVMSWYSVSFFDVHTKRGLDRKLILHKAFCKRHHKFNMEVWHEPDTFKWSC